MQGSALLPTKARAAGTRLPLWGVCAISATLSALIVSGTIWIGTHDLLAQARVGRALMAVWPSLDAATRSKVHERLGKS